MENVASETFDETSNSSTDTTNAWEELESGLNSVQIKDFIRTSLPRSVYFQTNHDINCTFCDGFEVHKLKQQLRKCVEEDKCNVKYSVVLCEKVDIGSISKKYEHNNLIDDAYNK